MESFLTHKFFHVFVLFFRLEMFSQRNCEHHLGGLHWRVASAHSLTRAGGVFTYRGTFVFCFGQDSNLLCAKKLEEITN